LAFFYDHENIDKQIIYHPIRPGNLLPDGNYEPFEVHYNRL